MNNELKPLILFKNNKIKPLIVFEEDIRLLTCYDIRDDMYEISTSGYVFSNRTKKIIHSSVSQNGYNLISLMTNDSGRKTFKKSRLVAKSFIKNDNIDKNIVNHKDLDKLDDSAYNLEWCTLSENTIHAIENKHHPMQSGEDHMSAKMTNEQVHQICKLLECGYKSKHIVDLLSLSNEKYNIDYIVASIASKRAWTSISNNYNIPDNKQVYLFTDKQVNDICSLLEQKKTAKEILNLLSIENNDRNREGIGTIKRRITYKRISKNYNW